MRINLDVAVVVVLFFFLFFLYWFLILITVKFPPYLLLMIVALPVNFKWFFFRLKFSMAKHRQGILSLSFKNTKYTKWHKIKTAHEKKKKQYKEFYPKPGIDEMMLLLCSLTHRILFIVWPKFINEFGSALTLLLVLLKPQNERFRHLNGWIILPLCVCVELCVSNDDAILQYKFFELDMVIWLGCYYIAVVVCIKFDTVSMPTIRYSSMRCWC